MKKTTLILFFIFCFFLSNAQSKGASNQFDLEQRLTIEQSELIYKTIKNVPEGTVISMAFVEGNKTKFMGIKRLNDTLVSYNGSKDIFEIGSLTKNISAYLLAELIVNKTVELNQEINTVLDFNIKNNPKITFNHLASHTSGLPRLPNNIVLTNFDNPYKNYSTELLKIFLADSLTLNQNVGEKWDYSNLGYGVLGYLLTHHCKKDLQKLYEENIFEKLQMKNTRLDRFKYTKPMVQGLDSKGKPCSNWDFEVMAAAGGLKSNSDDMVKFIKQHFNLENPAVMMVFKERMKLNENISSTMNWLNIKNKNIYISNGGTGGFSSSLSIQPESKKGIIILTNISGLGSFSVPLETLNLQLLNTLK